MTGFELRISVFEGKRSTNCTTATALCNCKAECVQNLFFTLIESQPYLSAWNGLPADNKNTTSRLSGLHQNVCYSFITFWSVTRLVMLTSEYENHIQSTTL